VQRRGGKQTGGAGSRSVFAFGLFDRTAIRVCRRLVLLSWEATRGRKGVEKKDTHYRVRSVFLSSGDRTSCLGTRTCWVMLTRSSDSWNASIVNC
jgi:hypothetical protein